MRGKEAKNYLCEKLFDSAEALAYNENERELPFAEFEAAYGAKGGMSN